MKNNQFLFASLALSLSSVLGCQQQQPFPPQCQNGIVEEGEECDDANDVDGDDCEADCTLPACGNGIEDDGEECDDTNVTNGDGCSDLCLIEFCGDGVTNNGEECDDANDIDSDECRNDCTLSTCRNGIEDAGELCFVDAQFFQDGGDFSQFVLANDVDNDGDLDVLTVNRNTNDVSVLKNNGVGGFGAPVLLGVGNSPQALAMGDLDADGDPDMVVVNKVSNNVSVLRNNGLGVFGAPTNLGTDIGPNGVTLGDLDGDNDLDMVTANSSGDTITVFKNNNGSFGAPVSFEAGFGPFSVALGDIDKDGDLDAVTANHFGDASGSILLNNGLGGFGVPLNINLINDNGPSLVVLKDLNRDTFLDIIFGSENSGTVSVLLSDEGTFNITSTFPLFGTLGGLAVEDFDNDGNPDIAASSVVGGKISILSNPGNGFFSLNTTDFLASDLVTSMAAGDFNNDSRIDLVTLDVLDDGIELLFFVE